ncbi:MAG: phospholipid carrier-dependent glycosyltransferase, partial [Armatimonadota bacterium]
MHKLHPSLLLVAILLGWLPMVSLWFKPPPLIGDEAYYARVPVEMRERGDWIVPYFNGEPRYKKPPLMYWLVALSQSVFGENEFASRLPSFMAVVLTGFLLAWFGFRLGIAELGLWAATVFLLNPMTVTLGNWGAPEATLCLFITASVLFGFLGLFGEATSKWFLLSGVAAGLGVLTKGAPGLVLPIIVLFPITIWKSLKQQRTETVQVETKTFSQLTLWLIACFVVAVPWFIAVWVREGEKFWQVFLLREHLQRVAEPMEGHSGPFWFYLPIVWLLFLPWSVQLPSAFVTAFKNRPATFDRSLPDTLMAWWAASIVILFSLVATKLPHYIFPALPALAWLAASQAQRNLSKGEFWLSFVLGALPFLLALYGSFVAHQAYQEFLQKLGFKASGELEVMKLAAYLLLLGFASVPSAWLFPAVAQFLGGQKFKLQKALLVSGVLLTATTLVAISKLVHASGGHEATKLWTKSQHIATFGSDTEWAVFYAKRPVPMLGRDREQLLNFLAKYPDAAILARVDFAPVLKRGGLNLTR